MFWTLNYIQILSNKFLMQCEIFLLLIVILLDNREQRGNDPEQWKSPWLSRSRIRTNPDSPVSPCTQSQHCKNRPFTKFWAGWFFQHNFQQRWSNLIALRESQSCHLTFCCAWCWFRQKSLFQSSNRSSFCIIAWYRILICRLCRYGYWTWAFQPILFGPKPLSGPNNFAKLFCFPKMFGI